MCTLREVTRDLIDGINRDELIKRYKDRRVIPGISIEEHLAILELKGDLETLEDGRVRTTEFPELASSK